MNGAEHAQVEHDPGTAPTQVDAIKAQSLPRRASHASKPLSSRSLVALVRLWWERNKRKSASRGFESRKLADLAVRSKTASKVSSSVMRTTDYGIDT